MSKEKVKQPAFVTPQGIAKYAWLNKPDAKFAKDGNGTFKVRLLIEDTEDNRAWLDKVIAAGVDHAKKTGVKLRKNYKTPIHYPEDMDEDDFIPDPETGRAKYDEDHQGKIFFECKSQFKPGLIDAKKNELPEDVLVMSGDVIKVKLSPNPYEQLGSGINFRLRVVQLIEKNTTYSGGGVDTSGFDEEDGYEYEGGSRNNDDDDEDEAF